MKSIIQESRPAPFRQPYFWTLVTASFFFALFLAYGYRGAGNTGRENRVVEAKATVAPLPELEGGSEQQLEEKLRMLNGRVGRQDTFYDILTAQNVSPQAVYSLVAVAKPVFDLGKIKVGNAYRLAFNGNGELALLEYEIDAQSLVHVERIDGEFKVELDEINYETREVAISARIGSSLYASMVDRGEDPLLSIQMDEIFAWDLDFNTDLRRGDRFSLVLEKKYREGKYVRNGRILGAEFINRGQAYRAVYFVDGKGRGDYYTEKGRSLRKQFLKAPLSFTRISSGYTLKRLHPVLKKYRPHQGVDYAAPKGTPVVAIGDGQVIWAGRKGLNGIFIKLKHNGIYTSSYGHLSRLGKGIKKGMWVKQGQVIGHVGSTGMATGPHLDFRIRKNGGYVNPLKLEMPSARGISRDELSAFTAVRDRMLSRLEDAGGVMSAKRGGDIAN
jgi:murein DD-endopeptidase MepM/ murein hydrolase activator NlpD